MMSQARTQNLLGWGRRASVVAALGSLLLWAPARVGAARATAAATAAGAAKPARAARPVRGASSRGGAADAPASGAAPLRATPRPARTRTAGAAAATRTRTRLNAGAPRAAAPKAASASARRSDGRLPSMLRTVSAPIPKLLPNLVPWPKGASLPEEHDGIWRTTNTTEDYFTRPLVEATAPNAHDRAMDGLLDRAGADRSALLIGGVNLDAKTENGKVIHTSSNNFDKSKLVRGQMNLAVANEQLVLRLESAVPVRAETDVKDLMKRLGQGPAAVPEQPNLSDLRVPSGKKGIVMLDYFDLSDDRRVNALIDKARAQPHKIFDVLVDPVNEAWESPRTERILRLQAARLPNMRLWLSRIGEAQQLQHRKIYNELIFSEIPELARGGKTLVFEGMAGVVPQRGVSFRSAEDLRASLSEHGSATIDAATAKRLGAPALVKLAEDFRDRAYPVVVEGDHGDLGPAATALAKAGIPVVPRGGGLQFRGLRNLQDLSNSYIQKLADWSSARGFKVRVRGQLFVATDRSFTEAVAYAIGKGGVGEFVVHDLRIAGPDGQQNDINQAGVERLVKAGANVRYFEPQQVQEALARTKTPPSPVQAALLEGARQRLPPDPNRKLHSKTFQVEVIDGAGQPIDWSRLSAPDRAAWSELWAHSDYPDMPLGPLAVDGSANLSHAGKNKNFELRAMTVGDAKGTAEVGRLLHEPLFQWMSRPVQLTKYVSPQGVPDLFKRPAPRQTRLDDPGVVYVAANVIGENESSEIWPLRNAVEGNAIVKLGLASSHLRGQGSAVELADRTRFGGPPSQGILVNPGKNFAGDAIELDPALDKYYGVERRAVAAQPSLEGVLDGWTDAAGQRHAGVVSDLRALETKGQPVLVSFAAHDRNLLERLNREGLREGLQNRFQIRDNVVVLDIQEGLHELMPKDGFVTRTEAVAFLGLQPGGTRRDAASAQILEMLPRLVDKLRASGKKVDTIGDLERLLRPGAHHWGREAGTWGPATAAADAAGAAAATPAAAR